MLEVSPVVVGSAEDAEPLYIDDPLLPGELIDPNSVDQLCERYDAIKQVSDKLSLVLLDLRRAIAAKTEGEANTRRVAGRYWRAKVTMPDESFDQQTLKRLWAEYPEFAHEYLRIASVDVRRVEFKKLVNTASDQDDFCAFRDSLKGANEGRKGVPRVEIERAGT